MMSDIEFNLEEYLLELLDTVQKNMFKKAEDKINAHIAIVSLLEDFITELNNRKFIYAPICNKVECEHKIRTESKTNETMGAKCLCIPDDQKDFSPEMECIICDEIANYYGLFGRSY